MLAEPAYSLHTTMALPLPSAATLGEPAVAVLVSSTPDAAVRLDDPVVQYAAGPRVNQALAVGPDALPATLPPASQVIVQGGDRAALAAARARYPAATLTIVLVTVNKTTMDNAAPMLERLFCCCARRCGHRVNSYLKS